MKLSTKSRYGAKAVIEIARNYMKQPTKRKDISKNQKIPDSYLENILIDLKKKGIIESIRGAKGGFTLKRAPSEITLFDIVTVLQTSLEPVQCVNDPNLCQNVASCVTRPIWLKLFNAQNEVLKGYTIQDLLDQEKEREVVNFCI